MFYGIPAILFTLWLLDLLIGYTLGPGIHALLVAAAIIMLLTLITAPKRARREMNHAAHKLRGHPSHLPT